METKLETRGLTLDEANERRIRHQLATLERRLVHYPEPTAMLMLTAQTAQRRIQADLRVKLGPLGAHLVSHQGAPTPDHATRLAVEDVERQLERHLAGQRGEAVYGVPSRREPEALRPNPPAPSVPWPRAEEEEEE